MKYAWKLLLKVDFYFILAVVFVTVLAGRSLIFESGYFNMHDDLQMMRQLQLEKCFNDFQIPCRWVPDMGYGFGYPLFNFYPQLPYLIGQIFRLLGLSFITTAKLTFALSFILSGIFMYLLGKEFFGRLGGLLSAVFYTWAPYHSVDIYVRGAMNEAWAIVWYPAICWASYRLIKNDQKPENNEQETIDKRQKRFGFVTKDIKWIVLLSLFWFGLLNSHNLMVMIFAPVFIAWIFLLMWLKKSWTKIFSLGVSGIWALGLSAFFTLPVLVEQKYTWVDKITEGYYNYSVHFANIDQLLFSRFWGYGPSTWLDEDRMSFQVGHLHWILSIFLLIGIIYYFFLKRKNISNTLKVEKYILPTLLMIAVGWFATFMAHTKSTPVWLAFEPVQFLQFPWRFLTISIFAFSFAIGALPRLLESFQKDRNVIFRVTGKWINTNLVILLSAFLIIWNWNMFKPEYGKMGPLTDEEKFSGLAWEKLQTSGIFDYLPITADTAPKEQKTEIAEIIEGEGQITNASEGTDWTEFSAEVESEEAVVRINILDFPDWRVFSNGQELNKFIPDQEEWGRIHTTLHQGRHQIRAELFDTPIRTYSNLISLASWLTLFLVVIYYSFRARNA